MAAKRNKPSPPPAPPHWPRGLGLYVLDENGEPREVTDTLEWGRWLEHADRVPGKTDRSVARTQIGPFDVSTVFLGIDHNHWGKGPPVLWETMIFGSGDLDNFQARYTSKAAALAGHENACALARAAVAKLKNTKH